MTFFSWSKGAITGRLFTDTNQDNTENAASGFEPGIEGQTVLLLNAHKQVVASTTTDAHGTYSFDGLYKGSYYIKVPTDVEGEGLVHKDVGHYQEDSDADTSTGLTDAIHVDGRTVDNIDFGYDPAPMGDGIVDGEESGETMGLGYDDSNAPTDQGGDKITDGGDTIAGNGGDDSIDGAGGNDLIYGGEGDDCIKGSSGDDVIYGDKDIASTGTIRESFEWDKIVEGDGTLIDNHDHLTHATQDTGNVTVSFDTLHATSKVGNTFSTDQQKVHSIDTGTETIDNDSSFSSILNGDHQSARYELSFSEEVENAEFRVNDIDGSGWVRIKAFDADGNEVDVDLTKGDGLKFIDGNTVQTKHFGNYADDTSPHYSALVSIPGPVAKITIQHEQITDDNSGINITDVYFDATTPTDPVDGAGNDKLFGGDGADTIFGEGGNDTIEGGDGNDVAFGGDGNDIIDDAPGADDGTGKDSFFGGAGDDTIWGGNDDDLLDGGTGNDDLDGEDGRDLILGGDGDGDDTLDGGSGSDDLFGGCGDDSMLGGSGHDEIFGGGDNDVIAAGAGDDEVYGGGGDDDIEGGDGNDTIYGDLGGNAPTDDCDGVPGNDTIDGGEGQDTIFGEDGNDVITGGAQADELFGGFGSDLFLGGDHDDQVVGGEDADGNDFDVLDLTGSGVESIDFDAPGIGGGEGDAESGRVLFTDGSSMTFEEIERVIPCFTPGTTIATPSGERLVEDLAVGDRILTRDNGIQEIRWVGHKTMTGVDLVKDSHLKPILIRAGALGGGLPERDMMVSPNHRVLVANDRTQLYFDETEVLASAKHLVGTPGIHTLDAMSTTYIHFMFDQHEVVLSNGAWTESFQPGDWSLKGIGNSQREEIFGLFPDLRQEQGLVGYTAARKTLKRHEARLLVD